MSSAEQFVVRDRLPSYSVELNEQFGPYACPCCGSWTLKNRGSYDICPVCFWEDDGQDDHDADEYRGGPNGETLTAARLAYSCDPFNEDRLRGFTRPEQASDRVPPVQFASSVWTTSAVGLVADETQRWLGQLPAGAVGRVIGHSTPLGPNTMYVDFGPDHSMLMTHERWVRPVPHPDGTPGSWLRFWSDISLRP